MRYRLSHSTLELLHACERKYQLEKILSGPKQDDNEHLGFGKGFGAGVASYLIHQDKERALFDAWLAYFPQIESDKKNIASMVMALQAAFFKLDDLLLDYELVSFQGKPACELNFRLNIDEDFYFVGYIDAVLKHRQTGVYVVFEVKTTGLLLNDLAPAYKHSGQALGYSIVLDRIVGEQLTSYGVLYFVAQLGKDFGSPTTIHVMPFNKTLLDRLNWFVTLGLDVKHLHEMLELGIFPRRGHSCLRFNRPCHHFGTCHLHALDKPREIEEDIVEYQFIYTLEELVAEHLERIQRGVKIEQGPSIEGECERLDEFSSLDGCAIPDVDSFSELDSLISEL